MLPDFALIASRSDDPNWVLGNSKAGRDFIQRLLCLPMLRTKRLGGLVQPRAANGHHRASNQDEQGRHEERSTVMGTIGRNERASHPFVRRDPVGPPPLPSWD